MRRISSMLLMLALAGCDLSGLDLSGIDDWNLGGGGGGGCCYMGTIRPVVSAETHLSIGSEFQLQAWDAQGNPLVELEGTFTSLDTTVLAVSPAGWAEARVPGMVRVLYGVGGGLSASTDFFVVPDAQATTPRLEMRGTPAECGYPLDCGPAGSPIIEGWIGHSIDVAGVDLTFVGADGLQPTDLVAATPTAVTTCQIGDTCVTVSAPSQDHLWKSGDSVLCIGVTVGDSVPEQAWSEATNREWVVTWSRPGLFVLRQPLSVYVRPSLSAPASAC